MLWVAWYIYILLKVRYYNNGGFIRSFIAYNSPGATLSIRWYPDCLRTQQMLILFLQVGCSACCRELLFFCRSSRICIYNVGIVSGHLALLRTGLVIGRRLLCRPLHRCWLGGRSISIFHCCRLGTLRSSQELSRRALFPKYCICDWSSLVLWRLPGCQR